MEQGVPIRSISRCIAVLKAIDRGGSLTLIEVARCSGLAYPTAVRTIQTLIHEGLVECEPDRRSYRSTPLVQTLSQGFHDHDRMVSTGRRHIAALTRKVGWPVSITTRVGRFMMLRDSTHALTSATFDLDAPCFVMPLLECAAGLVYVAHAGAVELDDIHACLEQNDAGESFVSAGSMRRIREDGYATREQGQNTLSAGRTSAVAVPLRDHGRLAGALELAYFVASTTVGESLERLRSVQATADAIAASLAALPAPAVPSSDVIDAAGRAADETATHHRSGVAKVPGPTVRDRAAAR